MSKRLAEIKRLAVDPALAILPGFMDSPQSRVMLYAISLQEAAAIHRRQIGGPAMGLWQFESGGGVKGVITHDASSSHAKKLCEALGVPFLRGVIYPELAENDVLAAGFARLLLLTDPAALPSVHDRDAAWNYYERTWRPGKPHPLVWPAFHAEAVAFVTGQA